ncbi:MAG: CehA/McbA family metallohydrolase, partial [Myxococcota bacterium]
VLSWLAYFPLVMLGCDGEPTPTENPTADPSSPTPAPTATPIPVTPTAAPVTNGAKAYEIEDEDELLKGPTALNRMGDFVLRNKHLKAVIQKPGRVIGWGMYGGTLIDAAPVLPDGSVGPDAFGELSLFFNLSHSLEAQSVTVEDDGERSGKAVIVAEGYGNSFDIIHAVGATESLGITIPYDMDAVFPFIIRTTYSLGPEDRYIHIKTEFINDSADDFALPLGDIMDSGGDVELYQPNQDKESYSVTLSGTTYEYAWGGFGEALYSLLDLLVFFGDGVSYGYLPQRDERNETNAMSVTISGVSVTVLGTTNLLGVFTGNPRTLTTVPAKGSVSIERDFVVGRDVASITDVYYERLGQATGTLQGQVLDVVSGEPVAGVRVGIVKGTDLDAPVTACYTDAEGRYEAQLPPGEYGVIAVKGFDVLKNSRPNLLTPQTVQITEGNISEQALKLGRPAFLKLTAQDGSSQAGDLLPVRAALYGPYTAPPTAVMDVSEGMGEGVARMLWLPNGEGTFEDQPGTYTVVITRGFEYDLAQIKDVTLTADQTESLNVILTKVLDTEGYISSDLHVHALNSPDSPVPPEDRVTTFVCEGVEVLVPTDHDVVSDLNPTIERMGLEPWITGLSGVEATTFNMGHFNQYPLDYDPQHLAGGAIDWTSADNLPEDPSTGAPVDVGAPTGAGEGENNLTPSQMARAYQKVMSGINISQVNHPRGDLGGHLTQVGLDLSQYNQPGETSADPSVFRLPAGADLFDIKPFRVLEVMNGTGVDGTTEIMNDWFALLNLGERVGGTGVSDTHNRASSPGGYGRTFIKVSSDDVVAAGLDAGFREDFARGIDRLEMSFGSGLFITTEVVGLNGQVGKMGQLVKADAGAVTLRIRVQAPSWSNFHTLEIFANPLMYANVSNMSFEDPSDLGPQRTLTDVADFMVQQVPVTSRNPDAFRREAVVEVPMTFTQDTWIVVSARGNSGELKPGFNRGSAPLAVSNPIFVDVNGDGFFQPPGQSFVLPVPEVPERQPVAARRYRGPDLPGFAHGHPVGKRIRSHDMHAEESSHCIHGQELRMLGLLLQGQKNSVHRR